MIDDIVGANNEHLLTTKSIRFYGEILLHRSHLWGNLATSTAISTLIHFLSVIIRVSFVNKQTIMNDTKKDGDNLADT